MHSKIVIVVCLYLLAALTAGCDANARRYPVGTKFYERSTHQYYGKVIAYEPKHDFKGGLFVSAVQIEPGAAGAKPVWAACDVIDFEYGTEPGAH